jgi:hypothetical protein
MRGGRRSSRLNPVEAPGVKLAPIGASLANRRIALAVLRL